MTVRSSWAPSTETCSSRSSTCSEVARPRDHAHRLLRAHAHRGGQGHSPMLRGEPARWATWLPGYGGTRVMIDGALTSGFDEAASVAIGLGWITVLPLAATALLRHLAGSPVLQRPSKAHTAHA